MSNHSASLFLKQIATPWKLRLFMLQRLPAAAFAGLKVVSATEEACTVSVPYKWATKNPFRSTYFACLSMAAELSTGVLAMAQMQGKIPAVSMLVTGMEAQFHKKAIGLTLFTCKEGDAIKASIAKALETGEGQTVQVSSVGLNEDGEAIATFRFRWSFKQRK